jgi:hypothetical protein
MAVWNKIKLSDIHPDRVDAEYFRKDYQDTLSFLKRTGVTLSFGRLFKYINRGNQPFYHKEGTIKALRSVNVGFMNFNETRQEYVTDDFFKNSNRGKVQKDDVLITSTGVGTLGRTSIWYKDDQAYCDGHITILRNGKIDPYFITAYLNSKYGLTQFDQNYRGSSGQIEIYPYDISKFIIPECIFPFQKEIGDYLREAFQLKSQSELLFKQATNILEQELGLNNISFEKKRNFTASFSEIASTRRMNAEYLSPLIKDILNLPFFKDARPLASMFKIVRGISPCSYIENAVPVIKTKNIRLPEIDRDRISDCVKSSKDFTTVQENDLLLASMGVGSLGRMSYIHLLEKEFIVDGTIRILRKKNNTPDNYEIPTLLFLSSKAGQELIYRGIVGSTGIISLPDEFLSKIPVPKFSKELALNVSEMVKKSMITRKQSKDLLAQAKNRVEQLIEEAI